MQKEATLHESSSALRVNIAACVDRFIILLHKRSLQLPQLAKALATVTERPDLEGSSMQLQLLVAEGFVAVQLRQTACGILRLCLFKLDVKAFDRSRKVACRQCLHVIV